MPDSESSTNLRFRGSRNAMRIRFFVASTRECRPHSTCAGHIGVLVMAASVKATFPGALGVKCPYACKRTDAAPQSLHQALGAMVVALPGQLPHDIACLCFESSREGRTRRVAAKQPDVKANPETYVHALDDVSFKPDTVLRVTCSASLLSAMY